DPRLLLALAALYGEGACLFKDKLIYKPPGVKGYSLHQDWIAWPGFPRSFLTVLVPLDRADADNGCTVVFPGYHHNGSLSPPAGARVRGPDPWSRAPAVWPASAASRRTAPPRTVRGAGGGSSTSVTTSCPTAAPSASGTTRSSTAGCVPSTPSTARRTSTSN